MLEITEGVLVNERSAAIDTMNAIRKLGVGLSLDDFGTGYSSLSRLAHLPIRELKIDRSFMRDIERDASALAIATAVVRVGQSLKMTVVAEASKPRGNAGCWPASAATSCRAICARLRCRRKHSSDGCSTMSPSRRGCCCEASTRAARSRRRRC